MKSSSSKLAFHIGLAVVLFFSASPSEAIISIDDFGALEGSPTLEAAQRNTEALKVRLALFFRILSGEKKNTHTG